MAVKDIAFSSGYITVTHESGVPRRYPIAKVLRALDIPIGLTYAQVGAIKTLANLTAVLIRTLIARDYLDDDFLEKGEYNLESITESIEEMGGDYKEPDISVT